MKTDIDELMGAINNYLCANEELQSFLESWKGGWQEEKTAKEQEDYEKSIALEDNARNALRRVCKLINIEV